MKWERGYRDAEGVFQKALVKARKDLDGLMFVMCEEEVRAGVVGWEEASEGDLMVLADLGAGDGSKREGIFASKKDEGGEELVNDWTFVEKRRSPKPLPRVTHTDRSSPQQTSTTKKTPRPSPASQDSLPTSPSQRRSSGQNMVSRSSFPLAG